MLQIPSGHLYLGIPWRLLHLCKWRHNFTFPIILWALHPFLPEKDPTILLVLVQSLKCPRWLALPLHISSWSPRSSLSSCLCSGSPQPSFDQCFLYLNEHVDHPGIPFKYRFWFCRPGTTRFHIPNKLQVVPKLLVTYHTLGSKTLSLLVRAPESRCFLF